jgi:hypothetical protein
LFLFRFYFWHSHFWFFDFILGCHWL